MKNYQKSIIICSLQLLFTYVLIHRYMSFKKVHLEDRLGIREYSCNDHHQNLKYSQILNLFQSQGHALFVNFAQQFTTVYLIVNGYWLLARQTWSYCLLARHDPTAYFQPNAQLIRHFVCSKNANDFLINKIPHQFSQCMTRGII